MNSKISRRELFAWIGGSTTGLAVGFFDGYLVADKEIDPTSVIGEIGAILPGDKQVYIDACAAAGPLLGAGIAMEAAFVQNESSPNRIPNIMGGAFLAGAGLGGKVAFDFRQRTRSTGQTRS